MVFVYREATYFHDYICCTQSTNIFTSILYYSDNIYPEKKIAIQASGFEASPKHSQILVVYSLLKNSPNGTESRSSSIKETLP